MNTQYKRYKLGHEQHKVCGICESATFLYVIEIKRLSALKRLVQI